MTALTPSPRKNPVLEDNTAIRRHVRHVTGIPIEITLGRRFTHFAAEDHVGNISAGGLCFVADGRFEPGEPIQVRIPILDRDTQLDGRVVWCNGTDHGYETGLEFDDPERGDQLRIIDQICQIECYRREVEKIDGLVLSAERAARESVLRNANDISVS